jgi:radical SAM/SPASM domain protein of ACGX system
MHDESTYKSELKNELSYKNCLKILDDFLVTTKKWKAKGCINFTGGDPLLKPEIYKLIKYASENGILVGILGNPNLLTYKVAEKLKHSGLSRYQISIDGIEKTHDLFRGRKGSFKEALGAIEILNTVGIRSVVMFTLSKANASELIKVIRLVAKKKVAAFDFARLVTVGSGSKLKKQLLSPKEYRNLLLKVLKEYDRFKEKNCFTYFGRKDHLWKLLYLELGLFQNPINEDKSLIYSGCPLGNNTASVLADGTVYACRRLPIKIGKIPEESLRDIFIYSKELNKMRKIEKLKKCRCCELLRYCRGCPAVAYGLTGNYYEADPQCWKEVI